MRCAFRARLPVHGMLNQFGSERFGNEQPCRMDRLRTGKRSLGYGSCEFVKSIERGF